MIRVVEVSAPATEVLRPRVYPLSSRLDAGALSKLILPMRVAQTYAEANLPVKAEQQYNKVRLSIVFTGCGIKSERFAALMISSNFIGALRPCALQTELNTFLLVMLLAPRTQHRGPSE
jgi:hypothetical protein